MTALSSTSRVISKRREKITALPLYYSGYLLKKYTGEKDFKRFFGELRGSTIFLYTDDMQEKYSEKVELQNLKEMVVDTSRIRPGPSVYTLTLLKEEIQLKIDNPDAGEEWRGFLMTVATLELPCKLQLLPGQMLRLEEVLQLERQRAAQSPNPTPSPSPGPPPFPSDSGTLRLHPILPSPTVPNDSYDDVISAVPTCFFSVSRQEAEQMLTDNPEYGSIILRPAADNVNYALTMRQVFPSGPVMKHYKVRSGNPGFIIDLEEPVMVPSLTAVMDHFLKETAHRHRPYTEPQPYDTCIVIPPDLPSVPSKPLQSSEPKTVPRARVAPMIRTQLSPPDTPSPPLPLKPTVEENEYLNPDLVEQGKHHSGELKSFSKELHQILEKRKEQLDTAGGGKVGTLKVTDI
ncbi:signal-transducing adaptor protein 1-like [Megalops cyprinoides]|uniref:signal-transducing adaptor protein 1-like n=1 Tax=Megalops cyprinoides TaxID=118141 RepID=UPI001864A299|nr:signal-transducing adaptor protein 1-like [Megalops cyprinoides]